MKFATGIKIFAMVGAVALAAATARANLITNPGFEVPTAPAVFPITGWALNSVSASAQITTGAGNVHSGSQAALLTVTATAPFQFVVTRTDAGIPITPDTQYAVSFWLKAVLPAALPPLPDLPNSSTLALVKVKGSAQSPTFYPTDSWMQYSYLTSKLPLAANPTEVQFEFKGPIGTQFYFDDVSFAAVPEPTTFLAGLLLLLPFGASALRILRRNFAFAGNSSKSQNRHNMSRQWGDNKSD